MEASGRRSEALASFERAADWDNVARMLIDVTSQPDRAKEVARVSRSPGAADRVARHCQSSGAYDEAIEFLLIARRNSDAYELAAAHNTVSAISFCFRRSLFPAFPLRLLIFFVETISRADARLCRASRRARDARGVYTDG